MSKADDNADKQMTEQEYLDRLWANPDDNSPDLSGAASVSAERMTQLAQARALNAKISAGLHRVQAPSSLKARLLAIPAADDAQAAISDTNLHEIQRQGPVKKTSMENSFLRRLLPMAAMLLIAIGIGLYYQPDVNAALSADVLAHLYAEEPYYGDGTVLAMSEVNNRILPVMADQLHADSAGNELQVTFAKDCLVAKQHSMHLVIQGESGPVSLMMIPSRIVDKEVHISDQRFDGFVTPASGGTMVVIGNKQEPISRYRKAFADSLNWEY